MESKLAPPLQGQEGNGSTGKETVSKTAAARELPHSQFED